MILHPVESDDRAAVRTPCARSQVQRVLRWRRAAYGLRQPRNFPPTLHQRIIRKGVIRKLLALADGVEPVRQLAGYIGPTAQLCGHLRRLHFTAGFQHPDQVMDGFPMREAGIPGGVLVGGEFGRLQQTHPASFRLQNPGRSQPLDTVVLGFRERFRHAELPFGKAMLLEPGQRPAGVSIEIAFLFRYSSSHRG